MQRHNITSLGNMRLARLVKLRWYGIVSQLALMGVAWFVLRAAVPLLNLMVVFATLVVINVMTSLRLKSLVKVSKWELALHLAIDVTSLAFVLYFTGGATNPFISLLLLPLAIGAASLNFFQVILLTLYSLLGYSILMFRFQPILLPNGTLPYHMHLIGMWITFALCSMLISWHVMRSTKELRNRDHVLAKAREKELQNQQIIALGTLATGAAHELSTPLSTIAILVPELESSCARSDEEKKDFQILQSQVKLCRSILTNMLAKAGATRSESGEAIDLTQMLEQIIAKWKLLRPNIKSNFTLLNKNENNSPEIWADDTIRQTLLNLLNNAADVSPDWVNIEAQWDQTQLSVVIEDKGPGLGSETAKHVGEAFFTTRQDGMGLGVFLAHATMRRFGGKILQMNRPNGGLKVTMILPLAEIIVSPSTGKSFV